MIYRCCNEKRKGTVLGSATLNGIDYLEVLDSGAPPGVPRQQTLLIHCLNPLSQALPFGPSPDGTIAAINVLIEGGESITNITVDWVIEAAKIDHTQPAAVTALIPVIDAITDESKVLVVRTHEAGDFSTYRLRLVDSAAEAVQDVFAVTAVMKGFDPQLAAVEFSFKVECGPDFNCAPQLPDCAIEAPTPPPINYLAKDYGSFRTIILDRLNQLLPGWSGTASEADLGVALAELIAYVGDHLSYQQDAVATEAYFETARRRVSLRRHALLVDYHVHDGCNARTWIQLQVSGDPIQPVFLGRSTCRFYTFAPGMPDSLKVGANQEEAALLSGVQVFEPMHDAVLYVTHNKLSFYTWGDSDCCLPKGATEASLSGDSLHLVTGDVLIFEEVKGPQTGDSADADLRHRCAVRLTNVKVTSDPLIKGNDGNPRPVTEIQWSPDDALPFPLCISSTMRDAKNNPQPITDVCVAYGNIVLADHGLSFADKPLGIVPQPTLQYPADPSADRCQSAPAASLPMPYRPILPDKPVTQAVPLATGPLTGVGTPVNGVALFGGSRTIDLLDASNNFACLTVQATNSLGWPQYFGVIASVNAANAGNFDLTIVFNPPGGAAGIHKQVPVEAIVNLSLSPTDPAHPANPNPNYAVTRINAESQLIIVPAGFNPQAGPLAGFAATPTMLINSAVVEMRYTSLQVFLQLQAADPASWPAPFGIQTTLVSAQDNTFDFAVVYKPRVNPAVTLEQFGGLSLADAATFINSDSVLVTIESFAGGSDQNLSAHGLTTFDSYAAVPSIALSGSLDGFTTSWAAKPDLLESGEFDPVFVVESEADGSASLRFGDGVNGLSPESGTVFTTSYRIGNGRAGNVGADSLIHLAVTESRIQACRNPLPATGGTDPETNDQIRRRAPQAFLTQERAVTMADYAAKAELDPNADYAAVTSLNPNVDRATASLRWTGSWYTVFVAVEPTGGGKLTPTIGSAIKRSLERFRLAGQDLQLDSPQYVSLQIGLTVCVDPYYFRSEVESALKQVLSNRLLPSGQKGLFYPDKFTFGQTVYLSPLYAAAHTVAGVLSVAATAFQPQGIDTSQYLQAGEIKLGPRQVARLDNDPNFPDHGQLTLLMEGGK